MELPFTLVDAYTDVPYGGNVAAVVAAADGLTTEQMRQMARALGQTETCFVAPAPVAGLDWALRWFTPLVEVDLCGHATVAAFVVLAAADRLPGTDGPMLFRCATRTTPVDVWVERHGTAAPMVTLAVGVAALEPAPDEAAAVAQAVGCAAGAIDPMLPLAVDPATARLVIPIVGVADLYGFTPNLSGMVAYGERRGYRRFTLVCRQTNEPGSVAHLRHFAPANGIPEDPVTGTAHAVAAVYLDHNKLLPGGDRVVVRGEQGRALGRQGQVTIEVRRRRGAIHDVRVGGRGVIVGRGRIARPAG